MQPSKAECTNPMAVFLQENPTEITHDHTPSIASRRRVQSFDFSFTRLWTQARDTKWKARLSPARHGQSSSFPNCCQRSSANIRDPRSPHRQSKNEASGHCSVLRSEEPKQNWDFYNHYVVRRPLLLHVQCGTRTAEWPGSSLPSSQGAEAQIGSQNAHPSPGLYSR